MTESGPNAIPPPAVVPHRLLRTGPALLLLMGVSFLFNGYSLRGGFQLDEFYFLNMLREEPPPYSRWLGFWAVDEIPTLTNTWWFEGGGTKAFWRPLPALIIEGSIRVFGERAFPLHLLSVVLHGLVAGSVFLLMRRLSGRPLVALLAGLLFLSCEDLGMVVGWISTMTDLWCALFINLALLAHATWLSRRSPWTLAASLGALVCALLSKESAVIAPLALVLMTLLMPQGRDHEFARPASARGTGRITPFLRDWPSWAPAVAVLVAYLVTYKALGFGGLNTGMYIDPLSAPGRYLAHVVGQLPIMWLATLSPVPPSLPMFFPTAIVPLAALGAAAFFVWLAGLWLLRRSALVMWALAVYLLALLPQMATDAGERGLYLATVPASVLLALLLVRIRPLAQRLAPAEPPSTPVTRWVGWAVLLCVAVPGVILSIVWPLLYLRSAERPRHDAQTILPAVAARQPDYVFLLNTPGFMHTIFLSPIIEYYAERPLEARVLSSMNGVMQVARVDERSFILRADRKGWLTNLFAGMLRAPRPLRPGRVYDQGVMTATLLELSPDRRDVLAVQFTFRRPLDDQRTLFAYWDGTAFRKLDLLDLPLGEHQTLADTSDVWASMW